MTRYAQIVGWGSHVPDRVLTNKDLEEIVDTNDEWIVSRTGIRERRIVQSPKETTASLATRAAAAALYRANIDANDVNLIICATTSPEHQFPATACLVQDALGARRAGAFDLSAACSGFVYALTLASSMITTGAAETILVIGSETLSRFVDWSDRNTCVLFGDGAGAVVVTASEEPGGILSSVLGSDGSGGDALILPAGGSKLPTTIETVATRQHYVQMDGRAVFRFATRVMASATRDVVARAGLTLDDIDLIIPHQANARIIESSVINQLKFPPEKVFVNVDRYGNTSTASIPIALCEAIEAGRVRPTDHIVFVSFGAGLTWAAAALKWGAPVTPTPHKWWQTAQRQGNYGAARAQSTVRRLIRKGASIELPEIEMPEIHLAEPLRNIRLGRRSRKTSPNGTPPADASSGQNGSEP
jgi:3-oxoacyl-[acyl-carrier-protein] synthase-3